MSFKCFLCAFTIALIEIKANFVIAIVDETRAISNANAAIEVAINMNTIIEEQNVTNILSLTDNIKVEKNVTVIGLNNVASGTSTGDFDITSTNKPLSFLTTLEHTEEVLTTVKNKSEPTKLTTTATKPSTSIINTSIDNFSTKNPVASNGFSGSQVGSIVGGIIGGIGAVLVIGLIIACIHSKRKTNKNIAVILYSHDEIETDSV